MANKFQIDGRTFEAVSTHALQAGDVIKTQGCLMVLHNRNEAPDTVNNNESGNVVWFRGYPISDDLGAIPASWFDRDAEGRRYWLVQGNGSATWPRLIERPR